MIPVRESWFRHRLGMEAKRYGIKDMKRFKEISDQIPTDVIFKILTEEADRLARLVVTQIESQPFWWDPLNEKYKAWKDKEGLSIDMLKATEEYIQAIGVQEVRKGKKSFKIRAGVPNRTHEASGLNFNYLGNIHENGTETIPARPHWGPALKLWKKRVPSLMNRIRGRVSDRLQKEFSKIIVTEKKAEKLK